MNAKDLIEKISDSLNSTATVKSVFGDPIHAEGRTVVPIAKVAYGFGAGSGSGHREEGEEGEGGGGGGGVRAYPAGALEITAGGTRFIRYHDPRWWIAAFSAGVVFAGFLSRRLRRM